MWLKAEASILVWKRFCFYVASISFFKRRVPYVIALSITCSACFLISFLRFLPKNYVWDGRLSGAKLNRYGFHLLHRRSVGSWMLCEMFEIKAFKTKRNFMWTSLQPLKRFSEFKTLSIFVRAKTFFIRCQPFYKSFREKQRASFVLSLTSCHDKSNKKCELFIPTRQLSTYSMIHATKRGAVHI